jgi:CO/xanthine dehydrogenase Mo-binding subunit
MNPPICEVRTIPYILGSRARTPGAPEMTSGRDAIPPYRLERADIRLHVEAGEVPTMSFRSLGAAPNVFAIESFVDELAHATNRDPIDFRLAMTDAPRLRRVLEAVRAQSAWHRPPGDRHGLGVACAIYHGTYIAQIAEVSVGAGGAVRLERVWCAVDAGRMVHPDGARNQIEGGVQQAASWTLLEELKVKDGVVTTSSWRDYPIATFHDAPNSIEVVFVGDANVASTGVGEPGAVPTAAAIANAVFAATGKRIRRLPIAAA